MVILQLLPVVLSVLVLGAHFFRAGENALVLVTVGVAALLFVRRPWAARAVQILLLVGAAEWLRTMTTLVIFRQEMGLPYTRLMLIISAVALWTGASALLFGTRRVSRRFGLTPFDSSQA